MTPPYAPWPTYFKFWYRVGTFHSMQINPFRPSHSPECHWSCSSIFDVAIIRLFRFWQEENKWAKSKTSFFYISYEFWSMGYFQSVFFFNFYEGKFLTDFYRCQRISMMVGKTFRHVLVNWSVFSVDQSKKNDEKQKNWKKICLTVPLTRWHINVDPRLLIICCFRWDIADFRLQMGMKKNDALYSNVSTSKTNVKTQK